MALTKLSALALSTEEQERLRGIERFRNELKAARRSFSHLDFGARDREHTIPVTTTQTGAVIESDTATVVNYWSKSEASCKFIYQLVRSFQPKLSLELGTGPGITAAYVATALAGADTLGRLITMDGSPELINIAQSLMLSLGLSNVDFVCSRFSDQLACLLKAHRFEFIFVDGHHSGYALKSYFDLMMAYLPANVLILLDDIKWSRSMYEAWKTIQSDIDIRVAAEFGAFGVLLTS